MDDLPVFVTGLPRTGKTQIRLALDLHPRLWLTRKTRLWSEVHGRYGDLSNPGNLDRCLEAIVAMSGVASLHPEPAAIRREFLGGPPTYARIFGIVYAQHARRVGAPRWGEQVGHLESFASEIFGAWPGATFVHMVRHPSKWSASPGLVGLVRRRRDLAVWRASGERAVANARRFAGRYMIVQLESLLDSPATVLDGVCAFIGEAATPVMHQRLVSSLHSLHGAPGRRLGRGLGGITPLLDDLGYRLPAAKASGWPARITTGTRERS